MRNISKTLAVLGLLSPVGVSALGIGDIRLQSALNQTLRAEIPLVTSGSETLDDIKVSIASNEAFAKAGIERHYQLSRLRFQPIRKPDGSQVIQVTSQEPIREPFLNFLIEVNWPQGRLLREFTVLLDPPATYKEDVEPIVSSPQAGIGSLPRSRESESTRPKQAQIIEEVQTSRRETAVSRQESAPSARASGGVYGPVQRDETLWSIAKKLNQDPDISQEQMVVALYRNNPEAFYKESFDALKAGANLRIPDRADVLRLSAAEARAQFYGRKPSQAGKLTARVERSTEAAPVDQLEQRKLKLLAPSDQKLKSETAAPGVQEETTKAKGEIALEVADTVKQENEEIRARLAQLEQQLASMRRLLAIKDEQIAGLQAQTKGEGPTPARPLSSEQTAQEDGAVPSAALVTPPPAATQQGNLPRAELEVKPVPPKAQPSEVKPSPPPPAVPTTQTVDEEAFFEQPWVVGLGGLGASLLGLYLWRGFKRRAALTQEAESVFKVPPGERLAEARVLGAALPEQTPSEQVAPAARSSFLSEFSSSDFDALGGEVDEVDPISEADVYLAYGRYKQAEELIRHAIEQYPDRDECKLKLLEIHYATENRAAFEAYARELFNEHKNANPVFWEKVVEMGRELCPDSPLFARTDEQRIDSGKVESLSEAALAASLELDDELLAELESLERKEGPSSTVGESSSKTAPSAQATSVAKEESDDDHLLDFEIPEIKVNQIAEQTPTPETVDNAIPFESSKLGRGSEAPKQIRPDKSLDDILMEMGALDDDTQATHEDDARRASLVSSENERATLRDDDFSLDFALIQPSDSEKRRSTDETEGGERLNEELTLESLDDIETRLDLARAFVDMGDDESARGILAEVLRDGSEVQKRDAEKLLQRLEKPLKN